jgi:hypothetical protein
MINNQLIKCLLMVNEDDLKYKEFLKKYKQFQNPYVFCKHFLLQLLSLTISKTSLLDKLKSGDLILSSSNSKQVIISLIGFVINSLRTWEKLKSNHFISWVIKFINSSSESFISLSSTK